MYKNILNSPVALDTFQVDLFSIRIAKLEEMDNLYLMGKDVWGFGMSIEEYLEECRTSKKYKSGIWYVIENNGKLLSSLIVYTIDCISDFSLIGIGSLATQLKERKKGYAAKLLNAIVSAYKLQYKINAFMLFAEIKIEYYKKLGFVALSSENQLYNNSVCMIHCSQSDKKYIEEKFKESNIKYF